MHALATALPHPRDPKWVCAQCYNIIVRTVLSVVLVFGSLCLDTYADPTSITRRRNSDVTAVELNEAPSLRQFESSLDVGIESFNEQRLRLDLAAAKLELTATWRRLPEEVYDDNALVRAWRTGARASYDFGWARLSVYGTYGHLENEIGSANNINLGLDVTRTIQLSRDVQAFFSLSFSRQRWLGRPLPGEYNASQMRLTTGLHWR